MSRAWRVPAPPWPPPADLWTVTTDWRPQPPYRAAVGILDRLNRLDDKVGSRAAGPRPGETRRDYLSSFAHLRWGYVPRSVYLELVELHDRVAALEAEVAELRAER